MKTDNAFPDLDALKENGFAILPSLISRVEIDAFEREIEELALHHLKRKELPARSNDAISDLLAHGGAFRKALFPQLKHLTSVTNIALTIREKLTHSTFADQMKMACPVTNWSIKADVPGEEKFLLPMHQDYKTPCHLAYRVWAPLRAANRANGTIAYVPGSHKAGYVEHDTSNPERPVIPTEAYNAKEVKVLELKAGDGFLFHPLLFHASVAANEDSVKHVVMVNFWDLATLADPEDDQDPINARLALAARRDMIRDA